MARDYPHSLNLEKEATRYLGYQRKKSANTAHLILAELCHQIGSSVNDGNGQGDDEYKDLNTSQGLVSAIDNAREFSPYENIDGDPEDDDPHANILIMK